MDYETEGEIKKLWNALRCKASCSSVPNFSNLPTYINNADAIAGGLTNGDLYKKDEGMGATYSIDVVVE